MREKVRALASAFKSVADDVQTQLAVLLPKNFPAQVPRLLWPHEARYLKALNRRLDKVAGNARKDAEAMSKIAPFAVALKQLLASQKGYEPRPESERLQWMLEEYRVSLFAQDLRTALPVSDKRLADQLELARKEARAA